MVDVQTVSIAIASASVVAGVIYYALQIRHQNLQIHQQNKIRQTDLLTRIYSIVVSKDWLEAWQKVQDREVLDHDEYKKKYGFVELNEVYLLLHQLGMLMKRGLIDIDMMPLTYGQAKVTWEKIKPIIEGGREKFNEPKLGDEVEYLCRELEKKEQRSVKSG